VSRDVYLTKVTYLYVSIYHTTFNQTVFLNTNSGSRNFPEYLIFASHGRFNKPINCRLRQLVSNGKLTAEEQISISKLTAEELNIKRKRTAEELISNQKLAAEALICSDKLTAEMLVSSYKLTAEELINSNMVTAGEIIIKIKLTGAELIRSRKLTAMVVEDTLTVRKLMQKLLLSMGFERVDCYEDGSKGLDAMMTAPVDIVFSDIQMPIMGGSEVRN